MYKINLKKTHRLLYRVYMIKALSAVFVGLGILVAPAAVFGSIAYSTITAIVPPFWWGTLWLLFGTAIIFGLQSSRYRIARLGLAGLIVLYMTLTAGLFTSQLLPESSGSYMFAVGTYAGLAITTFAILLEPPINPETAIGIKKKADK